ncbi:octanoyltransferase LipM [bacterium BMS3Bbin03]|nr:octanoyltransferase LipM [bacterium BMS3Bbin03]
METWRLLIHPKAPGDWLMAADVVIADFVKRGKIPPTFRVFDWSPDTISLGYHQNIRIINLNACRRDRIRVVRRPTGGKAIYHSDEITYSAIFSGGSCLYDSRLLESYSKVSKILRTALGKFPVKLDDFHETSAPGSYTQSDICFAKTLSYEITIGGKKLVGSAQRRWQNAVLQHGSILLGDSHTKLMNYLMMTAEQREIEKETLSAGTIYLKKVYPRSISLSDFSKAVQKSFREHFQVELLPGEISPEEEEKIQAKRGEYRVL